MCLFFFFIFRCFPPLLLNHVDVRHEVRNKLVLVLLATKRAFCIQWPCNYFTPFIMPVDRSDWLRPKFNLLAYVTCKKLCSNFVCFWIWCLLALVFEVWTCLVGLLNHHCLPLPHSAWLAWFKYEHYCLWHRRKVSLPLGRLYFGQHTQMDLADSWV